MSMCSVCQLKYRQAARQQAAAALYSKLPETLETKHAKQVTELQSEVSQTGGGTTGGGMTGGGGGGGGSSGGAEV